MKQRMMNTFFRITKSKALAKILAHIGYAILTVYYHIFRRIIIKGKKSSLDAGEAKKKLEVSRPKPEMQSEIINNQNDESVDLSIIVPAYNVEKYIEECISSIICQKSKYRYEVIIVNDGATDRTDSIIKTFTDKKIRYIVQENQGLSGARNTGLNIAVGKYVMFVDSDDILEDDSINQLMDAVFMNQADIAIGGYYTFIEKDKEKQYFVKERQVIDKNPDIAVCNMGFAWGKVCRRELFYNLRFPMGAWYEDTIICNVLYRMNVKIAVIDRPVYGYRVNPKGISKTARNSVKTIDHYWVMEDALCQAEKNGLKNDALQYELVLNHMSTIMYRRLSLMEETIIESAFILACDMLDKIRPDGYKVEGKVIHRDIEDAFKTRNYKLWKLASFIV